MHFVKAQKTGTKLIRVAYVFHPTSALLASRLERPWPDNSGSPFDDPGSLHPLVLWYV
jgi:hypothetical protein